MGERTERMKGTATRGESATGDIAPLPMQDVRGADRPAPRAPGLPDVSVVMPARNAGATVVAALDSVRRQDYAGVIEVVVADGSDTGAMAGVLRRRYPEIILLPNPAMVTRVGLRIALRAATGAVIVRLDAHAILPSDYITRAVETLERTGAAAVGGRQLPVGRSFFERAVAAAMSTPLGSGGVRYRHRGAAGAVDTVYLGVFRRDEMDKVGGYDSTMGRNEDYELNWRLRQSGQTVWFDPEIEVAYRPRGSLRALARQYLDNGRWKREMLRRHPKSVRARHLAAPLLVAALAGSAILAVGGATAIAAALPAAYASVLFLASAAVTARRREPAALLLAPVLATMHLSWGVGFFLPPRRDRASASA